MLLAAEEPLLYREFQQQGQHRYDTNFDGSAYLGLVAFAPVRGTYLPGFYTMGKDVVVRLVRT
jgi:hypothetical protein